MTNTDLHNRRHSTKPSVNHTCSNIHNMPSNSQAQHKSDDGGAQKHTHAATRAPHNLGQICVRAFGIAAHRMRRSAAAAVARSRSLTASCNAPAPAQNSRRPFWPRCAHAISCEFHTRARATRAMSGCCVLFQSLSRHSWRASCFACCSPQSSRVARCALAAARKPLNRRTHSSPRRECAPRAVTVRHASENASERPPHVRALLARTCRLIITHAK